MIIAAVTALNPQNWYYWLGGLGALIAAAVAVYKLRPEDTKVYIESADRLVDMAASVASMSKDSATDLRERNRHLDDRLTRQAADLGALQQANADLRDRVAHCEEVESRVDELTDTVRRLVQSLAEGEEEKGRLQDKNRRLQERVTELESEVASLKAQQNGEGP